MTERICTGIIFDLDGVLADSAAVVERTWRRWGRLHGLDPDQVLRVAHGRRTSETIATLAPSLDLEVEVARVLEWELGDTEELTPIPGAQDAVRAIQPAHRAVVTSGSRPLATMRLTRVGVPVPSVLVTADDVAHGKPDPEGYLLAATRLGMPPGDCVVVEDSPPGIDAAKAAGMFVLGVATTHAEKALTAADRVMRDLRDLRVMHVSNGSYRLRVTNRTA